MLTLNNGTLAITMEPTSYTLRAIDHVPQIDRPPYVGVGQVTRLPHGVALLTGFCGAMKPGHYWLILQGLIRKGFRVAYIERMGDHVVPQADRIDGGDFSGMWRVDLTRVVERRRLRHPAVTEV